MLPSLKSLFSFALVLIGTPSTTHNGCELPEIVLIPLMLILVPDPAKPAELTIETPGDLPARARAISVSGFLASSDASTDVEA